MAEFPSVTLVNHTCALTGVGPGRHGIVNNAFYDARLGVWLDLVQERGLLDDTVVLLTADHGMEAADPSCTGDWDAALEAAGIPFPRRGVRLPLPRMSPTLQPSPGAAEG